MRGPVFKDGLLPRPRDPRHRLPEGDPGKPQVRRQVGERPARRRPGSKVNRTEDLWGIRGRDVPAIALETHPGDLLMFNHPLKHASFGGGTRRRMFTINLEQRYRDEDLPELREAMGQASRFWVERAYGEVMMRTGGPSRMVHLEQRMANDGHLAELSRKAREEMDEPSRG